MANRENEGAVSATVGNVMQDTVCGLVKGIRVTGALCEFDKHHRHIAAAPWTTAPSILVRQRHGLHVENDVILRLTPECRPGSAASALLLYATNAQQYGFSSMAR